MEIIKVDGLVKSYEDRKVVDDVSLVIHGGEIYGLFGPNGSGKSTTIRMLTGLTPPNRGRIVLNPKGSRIDVRKKPMEVREYIGILTEAPAVYESMELFQYLRFYALMSRIHKDEVTNRVLEVVSIVDMEDHLYRTLGKLSMGEKQRVEIARVLLKDAPVLFLDEPFNGIDVTTRRQIRDYLKHNWLTPEKCIFFTSHNLLESEHFVDRFAFIYEGKIIATGDEMEMQKVNQTKRFEILFGEARDARDALRFLVEKHMLSEGEVLGYRLLFTQSSDYQVEEVIRFLVDKDLSFSSIQPIGTLEDIFIELVNEKREQEGNT